MNFTEITISSLVLVALLSIGHLWPWERFTGQELSRVGGYVWGTGSILAAFTVWGWLTGQWPAVLALTAIDITGGATVILLHWLRSWGQEIDSLRRKAFAYDETNRPGRSS